MPALEVMHLCELIDCLPDVIYTYIDEESNPELCRAFERIMDDFRDITRPFVKMVYVDKDCNLIRRVKDV